MYSFTNTKDFLKEYKNENITFPYKRLYYKNSDIKKMFKNLKALEFGNRLQTNKTYRIRNINFLPIELLYLGKPTILLHKPEDYENINLLSDMFQEENRMKCRLFVEKYSPEEYFHNKIEHLADYCLKKYKEINPKNLRDSIYENVKECTSFRPANLKFIIELYKVKSVLDFSSGWGDRLIAALATNVRYVGVDPNHLLHSNYKKMVKFFAPKSKKITMIEDTIQNAKLPNEKFDLVFTSPPYFDMEEYSSKGKVKDKSENEWFDNFLKVAINKTNEKLNQGGHMVLVINQVSGQNYIRKMVNYINTEVKDLHYLGVISYTKTNRFNPQPMWIWRKSNKVPTILYNPNVYISNHYHNGVNYNVFRDDKLIGGTKQRAIVSYMESNPAKKFIYAGPTTGYAQVALAYAASLTNKKAILYLTKQTPRTNLTSYALTFNSVELHEIPNANLKQLQHKAEEYHKKNKDTHMFSFGGYDEVYMKELLNMLKKSMPKDLLKNNPKRIWLVGGSATITNVLYKLFPKSNFVIVQVGKKIWPDQIDEKRTKLIISDEKFNKVAQYQPPYPTVATYDAKLWKYFIDDPQEGDYIWNVGKDIKNYDLGIKYKNKRY